MWAWHSQLHLWNTCLPIKTMAALEKRWHFHLHKWTFISEWGLRWWWCDINCNSSSTVLPQDFSLGEWILSQFGFFGSLNVVTWATMIGANGAFIHWCASGGELISHDKIFWLMTEGLLVLNGLFRELATGSERFVSLGSERLCRELNSCSEQLVHFTSFLFWTVCSQN